MRASIGRRRAAAALLAAAWLAGCGSDGGGAAAPRLAVLGAFPAELAAILAQASVEETLVVEGRTFRTGHIGAVPVVMAMTGIGLRNAEATTRVALQHFALDGVVVAGVAGSPNRIADVVVPAAWGEPAGPFYPADARWLARVRRLARREAFTLARCTTVDAAPVCMGFAPAVWLGGVGTSSDTFGSVPFRCAANGGEVFGCDVAPPAAGAAARRRAAVPPGARQVEAVAAVAVDMESAAIGRVASEYGVPYIAFRGVSDGSEDPLDLPGFPAQFFAYYPIAAHNAAAAAAEFVRRLAP